MWMKPETAFSIKPAVCACGDIFVYLYDEKETNVRQTWMARFGDACTDLCVGEERTASLQ